MEKISIIGNVNISRIVDKIINIPNLPNSEKVDIYISSTNINMNDAYLLHDIININSDNIRTIGLGKMDDLAVYLWLASNNRTISRSAYMHISPLMFDVMASKQHVPVEVSDEIKNIIKRNLGDKYISDIVRNEDIPTSIYNLK